MAGTTMSRISFATNTIPIHSSCEVHAFVISQDIDNIHRRFFFSGSLLEPSRVCVWYSA